MKSHLINCETSHQMWTRLKAKFTQKSVANKGQLWTQFYEYKFKGNLDILANITNVENIARQLKDIDEKVTEIQIINKILSILPSQYGHFNLIWECLAEKLQTMEILTMKLNSEERRSTTLKQLQIEEAYTVETQNSSSLNLKRKSDDKDLNVQSFKNYCNYHRSKTHSNEECHGSQIKPQSPEF